MIREGIKNDVGDYMRALFMTCDVSPDGLLPAWIELIEKGYDKLPRIPKYENPDDLLVFSAMLSEAIEDYNAHLPIFIEGIKNLKDMYQKKNKGNAISEFEWIKGVLQNETFETQLRILAVYRFLKPVIENADI